MRLQSPRVNRESAFSRKTTLFNIANKSQFNDALILRYEADKSHPASSMSNLEMKKDFEIHWTCLMPGISNSCSQNSVLPYVFLYPIVSQEDDFKEEV